jgi:homogentisate 1,2-dioxygenase
MSMELDAMSFYHKLGQIPPKRHIQFRKPNGELYREQVMGLEGFSGMQSISYHHYEPTRLICAEKLADLRPAYADFGALRHRHLVTTDFPAGGDIVTGRRVFLGNNDILIGICRPTQSMDYFYRNGQAYEMLFVHDGEGALRTNLGNLDFGPGDYIIIPYNVTWQMQLKGEGHRFLTVESPTPIVTPKRYRNHFGQLLEHSPYCERDFRPPQVLETYDETGEFEVRIKARDELHRHVLDHHPLDVVGWDGYLFPFAFNINDFEPITGRVHQPPPVHQTWEGHNYVVCSFVPRLFDYHPLAIPAPYNHANVQSDEVLYYVEGNFMSRKGILRGSFTLHPSGLPHGPHPGTVEASIGKERTEELAVMIDTFRPLQLTMDALEFEDPHYATSWVTKN